MPVFIKPQAVAYMVEGAVGGVKALLGYIATNERVTTRPAPIACVFGPLTTSAPPFPAPWMHAGGPRVA